jgi:hypothetical protein
VARQTIDVRTRSPAGRDAVWRVLADGARWSEWGPWRESTLEREGEPPPDGVGAVRRLLAERRFLGRPVLNREEVTVFDVPAEFGYTMLSGLPLRDYQARVRLSDDGEGTAIHWHVEFDPKLPGTGALFRRGLEDVIADVAERAARAAAGRDASQQP